MLTHPDINPVAIAIGPLKVHWYGITYLLGFLAAWFVATRRVKQAHSPINKSQIEDLIVYCALGVVIGGRLGYVFFYDFQQFLNSPVWLFKIWDGGMAFHGGLIGVIVAVWLYAKKVGTTFSKMMDFTAPMVPIGLGLGRMGNFIGQELYGRVTDVPWGMVFPKAIDQLPRHPSQLYQAFLEGLVLFVIIYWYSAKRRPPLATSALFVVCYGFFRFLVEYVRQPDRHLEPQFWLGIELTRGQQLCIPMILVGMLVFVWAYYRDTSPVSIKNKK